MEKDISAKPSLSQVVKERIKSDPLLHEGDVIEARLLAKAPREAYFDIGKFSTGIVYGQELINARELLKKLAPGDAIAVKVIELDGERGYVELSLSEADEQRLWQDVKELQESGEVIKVTIAGANAGGLITNIRDLKAFLPVSRLSNEHYPKTEGDRQRIIDELKKLVGQELDVKVIDVNPRSKKLIVSERETLSPNLKETLANYKAEQEVDVLVSGIADFGVFVKLVDNPQIEGLIHVSELDHRLVSNPKEKVELNQTLKAKIIEIRDDGRVFLSLKALAKNPWDNIRDTYAEGQVISGTVYKFNPFGSIIDLGGDLQGIIHVSEFGGLEEMKKELALGEHYNFIIESIKPEEKRLILKLKK